MSPPEDPDRRQRFGFCYQFFVEEAVTRSQEKIDQREISKRLGVGV